MESDIKRGERVKRIREEKGLTQPQLACKGMDRTVISKLENGKKELNYRHAYLLSKRYEKLGYSVSIEVLLGIPEENIEEIVEKFIKNPYDSNKFDKLLENLCDDRAVEIILRAIEELKANIYQNADCILTYIFKLTQYHRLDDGVYLKLALHSIMAYAVLGNHLRVVSIYNSIKEKLDKMEKEDIVKCYFNTSMSYYKMGEYKEALALLDKCKKCRGNNYEFQILTLEANILTLEKKFKDSIKINEKIISKAKKSNIKNYIANSYSNIAYMLIEQKKFNEAKVCLDNAMTLFDDIKDYYKLNVYDNIFYFELKTNKANLNSFKEIIRLAIEFGDKKRENNAISKFITYNIEHKQDEKIFESIFEFLSSNNIRIAADLKITVIEYIYKDSDLLKKNCFLKKIISQ